MFACILSLAWKSQRYWLPGTLAFAALAVTQR